MSDGVAMARSRASFPIGWLDSLVEAALAEDVGDGDRTTMWTIPPDATGAARVVSRTTGVIAGEQPVTCVFGRIDPELELRWACRDGDRVKPGDEVLGLLGSLGSILTGERTALNFLARLSGIATLAARYVDAVRDTGCRVTDTRKTTPGWRELEKRAVAAGGASNHRSGLYDMVLIKENHTRAVGGVGAALRTARPEAARQGLEVEVEVGSMAELEEALDVGADRVLLDNMGVEELRRAVERVRSHRGPRPLLEASGGIGLDTVRAIAETGVDLISVGAITHSAPALDLSLLVVE